MKPYFIILFVNLLLSYIADRFFVQKKTIAMISVSLIVVINTVFSGFRDFGVGIDTTVYINSFFESAQMLTSLKDFASFESDKGFLALAFLASSFSNDSQSLLLVTAFFIQFFYFCALWLFKKYNNVSLFLATFFFCIMFYGHTLNLMRQFCALSILAYGFANFIKGNLKVYIYCQLVAYFFHSSAIIFVILPIMWRISFMQDKNKKNVYSILAIVGMSVIVSLFFLLMSFLGNFGLISDFYAERYSQTGSYAARANVGGTGLGVIAVFLYPIVFVYYAKRKKAINENILHFVFVLTCFSSLLQLLTYKVTFLERVTYYITFILFIYQAKLFSTSKINILVKFIMIAIYIYNWYALYIINKGGDIIPYKSHILNIL